MTITKHTIFLFSLLLFLSCASQKKIIPDLQTVTYRDLLLRNSEWQKSIQTLIGSARISLDTPQYSGNFNADIALNGNDSLLISVTGPLGIRVGKVFVAKNRFIFYNQVMNQFYTGSKENFKGRNFLQFPVEITQLRDVLLAHDKFDVLKKDRFEIRDQMYYLSATNGKLSYNIWFDPELELIKKIEYLSDGDLLFHKEYDQFQDVDQIPFPKAINFVKSGSQNEAQGLSIYFKELIINENLSSKIFDINVSDSADQIDLSLESQN